jgi:hypothetical protein
MNASVRAMGRLFGSILVGAGLWSGSAFAQSCAPDQTAHSYSFTGSSQTLTVPAGVRSATVYLGGAQGNSGKGGVGTTVGSIAANGGAGGWVGASLAS